jgi:hypothetical protein
MWNLSISIVSPLLWKGVEPMFHCKDVPDVVIVSNGGAWGCVNEGTHFSATGKSENI